MKKKVRKPSSILWGRYQECSLYASSYKDAVIIQSKEGYCLDKKRIKKLRAWLTRAIAYLEQDK